MNIYDLAIAYSWEYDDDFIEAVQKIFHERGLSFLPISFENLNEVLDKVKNDEISIRYFLDRASDAEEEFVPLAKLIQEKKFFIINQYSNVEFAIDKATMHLEFITNGINTPFTIIISPYKEKKNIELSIEQLAKLGRPFIIKPANTTGGGIGVVLGAETLADVLKARQHLENDKYLLQEKIEPIEFDGKRFWFRSFYAFGKIIHCWWNDITHIYKEISSDEFEKYNFSEMNLIVQKIQKITNLEFFSTEIAFTKENKFIVIDYVNDQCDMRFQSKHYDGVPDNVIYEIINSMADFIEKTNPE
ncbi:MAG: RimK family alpha-L-glutamate ligase [Ignavibacteria bacterium]